MTILPALSAVFALTFAGFASAAAAEVDPPITAAGAVCDGASDDTAAVNRFLATFAHGGLVHVPAGRRCLIASGDLVVPRDVIVHGASSPLAAMDRRDPGSSGFLLDPAYTVALEPGASLRDLSVTRAGLIPDPTDAQVIAAVAAWGREASRAITLRGGGVRLEHLYLEGFNTAIYGYSYGDFIFSDVVGDDYNGVVIAAAGDNSAILDARFEPFYAIRSKHAGPGQTAATSEAQGAAGSVLRFAPEAVRGVQPGDYANILDGPDAGRIPLGTTVADVDHATGAVTLAASTTAAAGKGRMVTFGGAWARPGVSFYLQGAGGNTTGWYCVRCFSFEYRFGAIIDSVGAGYLQHGGFEWQQAFDPATNGAGTVGVRLVGSMSGVAIGDTYSGGHSIEFSDEAASSNVDFRNLAIGDPDALLYDGRNGPSAVAGLFLQGAGGAQVAQTLGGDLAPGDTATVTVGGVASAYVATAADTKLTVALALARRVNSDAALAARHVSAHVADWASPAVVVSAPAAHAFAHSASGTGALTVSEGARPASLGSWGQLSGYTTAAPDSVPAIVVGPDSRLPFRITGFPLSNTGGPAGGISIDPTSAGMIQLQNLPAAGGLGVAGCGAGAALAPGATDARGTVTEGAAAMGCTLSFRTRWPVTPVCVVSSPNGAPWTGYAATQAALTLVNPPGRGGQYTYQCQP